MAKSKHSPALFELIDKRTNGKGSEKLSVPTWFKGSQPPSPEDKPSPESTSSQQPQAPAKPAPKPIPSVAQPASGTKPSISVPPPTSPSDEQDIPVLQIRSGRIELSLNPVNAAIVAGVVLLTVFSSYLIGQSVGAKNALPPQASRQGRRDVLQEEINRPANPGVLIPAKTLIQQRTPDQPEPQPVSKAKVASPVAERPTPAPGAIINYVVVESFNIEHRKAAEYVQKWLAEQGLDTELKKAGKRWRLVTTGGFDVTQPGDKAARDKLIEDLKAHGSACAEALRSQGLPEYWLKGPMATR